MKVRTFFAGIFAVMFLLATVPFSVSHFDARSRERTTLTLQKLKAYNDSIMAVGLQIRGIQNGFIRATLEKAASGPDMDKLRAIVKERNSGLDELIGKSEQSFAAAAESADTAGGDALNRENLKRFLDAARDYQKAVGNVLARDDFSTRAIDEVAPFINAGLAEVGKEIKASNALIAMASDRLLADGQRFQWVYILANSLILVFIVAAFLLIDRKVFRRLAIALVQVERVKEGHLDLDVGSAGKASDEFSLLLLAIANMAAELGKLIREIDANGSRLLENAESISVVSDNVVSAAAQQSDATSAMAAAIEELTVSSAHIADRATDTERYSSSSAQTSIEGVDHLDRANEAILLIAQSADSASRQIEALYARAGQISNIASVIKEIAGQTNLLALNAAIEAARAGEQGRGFAVVADEVRKLAERTANSTSEIEQMIAGVQQDTRAAVEAMGQILPEVEKGKQLTAAAAQSLSCIRDETQQTLRQIQEISSAIREQSAASSLLAQQVDVVAQMAEKTATTSRSSSDIVEQLRQMARDLRARISHFTV
ncbi:methyl-accepting chemotaxis protein [Niveibacterium terrae]|uniref:methyl-accepting chemotaxis protein n=1 Tax=Niveibacterium terrae TaxID=3373598 RepID=UPI003A927D9C